MENLLPAVITKLLEDNNSSYEAKIINTADLVVKEDASSHDISHLKRVYDLAKTISGKTRFAIDIQTLLPTCYFHDVGYNLEIRGEEFIVAQSKSVDHEKRGALFSTTVLNKLNVPMDKINSVAEAIRLHDNFRGSANFEPTNDPLCLTLQDADRLDAIGFVGLTRWFRYAKLHNIPNYNANVPFDKQNYGERSNISVLHNLKSNAINLYKDLNLDISKEIGRNKSMVIQDFIDQYLDEYGHPKTTPHFGAMALAEIFRESKDINQIKTTISNKLNEQTKVSQLASAIISGL